MHTQISEPGIIQTLLFDRSGRATSGEHRSFYEASASQVDLKFEIITSQEMHVVFDRGDCFVVPRCYSAVEPFCVQDRIVPSLRVDIEYIHSQLSKGAVTPAANGKDAS